MLYVLLISVMVVWYLCVEALTGSTPDIKKYNDKIPIEIKLPELVFYFTHNCLLCLLWFPKKLQ